MEIYKVYCFPCSNMISSKEDLSIQQDYREQIKSASILSLCGRVFGRYLNQEYKAIECYFISYLIEVYFLLIINTFR